MLPLRAIGRDARRCHRHDRMDLCGTCAIDAAAARAIF